MSSSELAGPHGGSSFIVIISQDGLAYAAEVIRSYLSQLEKGAFYAGLKIVGRLAQALDTEPTELLTLPRPGRDQ